MRPLRQIVYESLAGLGVEVHRRRNPLGSVLGSEVKTILDIGANSGQFATAIRRLCPEALIYSFEPLPAVFERLCRAAAVDGRWQPLNLCLGDSDGSVDFFENEFTAASSILPLTVKSEEVFPHAARTNRVSVQMTSLDSWAANQQLQQPLLVKMDVQGFEDRVIRGGQCTIRNAQYVICEVSFCALYEGQPLFHDIYTELSHLGFSLGGILGSLHDPRTDQILQSDALFLR
jgi:FkbM family methyltransferase